MTRRGVLIGCGFFAANHMHAWAGIDGAEIVAICDLDPTRLEDYGARFGIARRYRDAATMLAEVQPDFADIATTVESHRQLVELCAPHVRTVICQKPFAESLADGKAMVDACDRHGSTLMVHENFRWLRSFVVMKALIDAGRIGRPQFARFSFRHGYDNYRNQPYLAEIARFAIMDVGLHLFDLAGHFFGDVTHLSCVTQRLNPAVKGEDAFTALLRHEGGAATICDCSFYSRYHPEPFPATIAVIEGSEGTLELDRALGLVLHRPGGAETIPVMPEVPPWGAPPWHVVQDSVIAFQRHAVDVMEGRAAPQPSGAHNLETLRLALAAYEAAERGSTIAMADWRETSP